MPKSAISLAQAERLIAAFETSAHHPQFFEQTLYALMASALNKGGMLPSTYNISWGYLSFGKHLPALWRHSNTTCFISRAPPVCSRCWPSRGLSGRN